MRLGLFILSLSISCAAQTTVIIPAPDGKTICSTANVWSTCGTTGLPPGVTVDSSGNWTFANPVTMPSVVLTSGPTLTNGQYIANVAAGVLTFIPYNPQSGPPGPTGPPGPVGPPGPSGGGSSCTALIATLPPSATVYTIGSATPTLNVQNSAATLTAHVYPTASGWSGNGINFEPFARIPFAGSVFVYARYMPAGAGQSFPGGTVNLEVCP